MTTDDRRQHLQRLFDEAAVRQQRVRALFDRALDLPGGERQTFLDAECAGDPELRAEVNGLLDFADTDSHSGSFLRTPLHRTIDTVHEGGAAAPSERLPAVPGYEIEGVLGRGGMGVVYRARDLTLRRTVAVKMVLAGAHASDGRKQRFKAEAEAIAALQHPHIVQIYEAGEAEGLPFLALEYCAGGSLEARLAGGPLPPHEAAALLATLAGAVQHAHERGILHRDLKPANILLASEEWRVTSDEQRQQENTAVSSSLVTRHSPLLTTPKITDFGLAKQLDESFGQTAEGVALGTPSYMAPEQAQGRTDDVGPRCDVYALGAILYECLTGRPPFRAATPFDTIRQVIDDDPLPASRLNRLVPRDLDTICLKCLHKATGQRYESARALADDLNHFLRGEPIRARPGGPLERAVKWSRRHPAAAAFVAVCVLATLLVVGGSLYFTARLSQERDDANRARRDADDERALAKLAQKEAEEESKRVRFQLYRADVARHAGQLELALNSWQRHDVGEADRILADVDPRFADAWETRFVRGVCRRAGRLLTAHDGPVTGVAFQPAPPGTAPRRLATAGKDGRVKLWDPDTGQEVRRLDEAAAPVVGVAFTPDGKHLLAAAGDKVFVWDAAGDFLGRLTGARRPLHCLAVYPDNKRVVAGGGADGKAGEVTVWDLADRKQLFQSGDMGQAVEAVAVTPGGKYFATGGSHGEVGVWDAATYARVRSAAASQDPISSLAFSPTGERLLTCCPTSWIYVWETSELVRQPSPQSPRPPMPATTLRDAGASGFTEQARLVGTPDGGAFLITGRGGVVRVRNIQTRDLQLALHGHTADTTCAAYGLSQLFATGDADGKVRVWNTATELHTRHLSPEFVLALAVRADGREIVVGEVGGPMRHWAADRGPGKDGFTAFGTRVLAGHAGDVTAVCFVPGEPTFASVGRDGALKYWDPATIDPDPFRTTKCQSSVQLEKSGLSCLAFPPDGQSLVAGGPDTALKRYDRAGKVLATFDGRPTCVAFSPDGKEVAFGLRDGGIRIAEAATGRTVRALAGHTGGTHCLAYARQGWLVSGGADRTVRLWDPATGRQTQALADHLDAVKCVTVSTDGTRVFSGGADRLIKVWDVETGQIKLTLRGHDGEVTGVTITTDGRRLISASLDRSLRVWEPE